MSHQNDLPFAEAEASAADDRALMNSALAAIACSLHERVFVEWVFNVSTTGKRQPLKRSYKALASTPLGLCCHPSTARRTVERVVSLGLITRIENYNQNGDQTDNGYVWSREGCRELVLRRFGDSRSKRHKSCKPAHSEHTPAHSEHTPAHSEHTPAHSEHPSSFFSCSFDKTPVPVPEREPVPAPCPVGSSEEKLRKVFFLGDLAQVPVIADNLQRSVTPLPARTLGESVSVFKPINAAIFNRPDPALLATSLTIWFRRQLSAPFPVSDGASVGELLVVVAVGLFSSALPASEVKKNRAALFSSTLMGCKWFRVMRYLSDADDALEQALTRFPDLLTCDDGAWSRQPASTGGTGK